jgi:hypothetical protein
MGLEMMTSPGWFHQVSRPPAENASATTRTISESQRWNRPIRMIRPLGGNDPALAEALCFQEI